MCIRDSQCGCRVVARDLGLCARARAFEESGEFALQRLILFNADGFADNPASRKFCDDRRVCRDTEDFSEKRTFLFLLARQPQQVALLLLVIEREVGVLLKHANLAESLLADAARGCLLYTSDAADERSSVDL